LITEQDLLQAIAECQGEREPNANTCIKLAAFYTIYNQMFGKRSEPIKDTAPAYSFAASPAQAVENPNTMSIKSDSAFARAVNGRNSAEVMQKVDDLISTLSEVNPRLYRCFMRQLKDK
jgi:hypothetical protein